MRRISIGSRAAASMACFLLAACGSDTEPSPEDFIEEAEEILQQQGVNTDGGLATATMMLNGETYEFSTDEPFGCYLTESGGSMGAVDFTAELEDGTGFAVGWAGDTPELSSRLELMFPGGSSGWNLGFGGQFDTVEITPPTATLTATVSRFGIEGAGEQAEATVNLSCP